MKTVSLIWGYSQKNAGDLAMTLGAIDLLPNIDFRLQIFSLFNENNEEYQLSKEYLLKRYSHIQLEIIGSVFYLDKAERNPYKIIVQYLNIIAILLGIKNISTFRAKLLSSDLVLFNGGNMFRCISLRDAFRMFCVFSPIKMALDKNIPCIVLPQSAASINKIGKKYLLSFLNRINTIFLRENRSYKQFQKDFELCNIKECMDLAFFINKDALDLSSNIVNHHVALTIRARTIGDRATLPQEKLLHIEKTLCDLIDRLMPDNKITIVVQVPIDRDFSFRIKDHYGEKIQVLEETDPVALLKFYSNVDLLIGMRLHSMILAMSAGTPCFGISFKEWGNKIPGILEIMNMPYLELDDYSKINFEDCENLLSRKVEIKNEILRLLAQFRYKLASEINNLFQD